MLTPIAMCKPTVSHAQNLDIVVLEEDKKIFKIDIFLTHESFVKITISTLRGAR